LRCFVALFFHFILFCVVQLQLAAVRNDDGLAGRARAAANGLDLLHDVQAINDLAEDNVLAVQVGSVGSANEELGSVGVGTSIRHGQSAGSEVAACLAGEGLVGELLSVDGLATTAIATSEVSALAHEAGDHTVEGGALVVQGLARLAGASLSGAQRAEVLGGLGGVVGEQLHGDATGGDATDSHIKEHSGVAGVDCGSRHDDGEWFKKWYTKKISL